MNVVKLHPSRDPDEILEGMKGRLNEVLVVGFDDQGVMQAEASADMSTADVVFLLRLMERAVLDSVTA